ncbi:Aldo-keto reductase yakc [Pleurostoma richardsiae]|uniref:Aldo-keto reductase yakc n=1 Tax=Pleurostoma richardsiae TaxID=41990 RepID=A0AA38VLL7_9PEZI|nr:Aldo-keto reductase yakc [Pleurostoma richardsiae]
MAGSLPTRKLGKTGPEVPVPGLGLMGISTAYGKPGGTRLEEERLAVLDRAWELGCRHWDTADIYGDSEDLVGRWFKLHPERRQDIFLATKFGLSFEAAGFGINSSPEYCRQCCEKSLSRLGVDSIDLFYIHRVDGRTPIEKTMEVLIGLKREGKIKHIGISAPSSNTLRRACALEHVTAVQVEYSPWTLDIEGEEGTHLLATCRELGVAIVAYSPLGRGILTGQIKSPDDFGADDMRRLLPRFNKENFAKNLVLVEKFKEKAARDGCTPGQLAIAWVMAQGDDFSPIPGTKNVKYLEENVGAARITLSPQDEREIRSWMDECGVAGLKAPPGLLDDFVDTPPL